MHFRTESCQEPGGDWLWSGNSSEKAVQDHTGWHKGSRATRSSGRQYYQAKAEHSVKGTEEDPTHEFYVEKKQEKGTEYYRRGWRERKGKNT